MSVALALSLLGSAMAMPWLMALERADEGMSSWRHAVCEFFAIALHLNATVAEPCVVASRINSCEFAGAEPLASLLDTGAVAQKFGLRIVSHAVFKDTASQVEPSAVVRRNMHVGSDTVAEPSFHNAALPALIRSFATRDVVVFYRFRKFSKAALALSPVVNRLRAALTFAAHHRLAVERFERELFGTAVRYAAVHWRSEEACRDYGRCATVLLAVKSRLCAREPSLCPPLGPPVLLISDLTANQSASSWQVMRAFLNKTNQVESAERAYKALTRPGQFVKLDQVLQTKAERLSSARPIWDLMMGMRADRLLTCHDECAFGSLCHNATCARHGNFMYHLQELRESARARPIECW